MRRFTIVLVGLVAGLASGVSYGDYASNHTTYVPPGLHLADPSFLAHDWWLTETVHYHWAFSGLVAVLAWADQVPWGLAVLNVAAVAGTMWLCHGLLKVWQVKWDALALVILAALLLSTRSFRSVALTYLFSPSLQASSVSTVATVGALACFARSRFAWAGVWLAVAGAFHANFLFINLALFGLAYAFARSVERRAVRTNLKAWSRQLIALLGPSLAVLVFVLPLVLAVADQQTNPETAELARFALFDFAVPFHYVPRTFLMNFFGLLGWQVLGVAWTAWAVADPAQRRLVWSLQLALGLLLWGATALTTFVFIEPVSRLFFWRLAPVAELLGGLLLLAGTFNAVRLPNPRGFASRWPIALSAGGLLLVARNLQYSMGVTAPVATLQLAIVAALVGVVWLKWQWDPDTGDRLPAVAWVASVAMLLVTLDAHAATAPYRYSLIRPSESMVAHAGLFEFVRENTPDDAQFVVPPDMRAFRLFAERAVVVELTGLPLGEASIVEWYQRLEAISGTHHPENESLVIQGYASMDENRLERVRSTYGATHAVVAAEVVLPTAGWVEIYRDDMFRVLEAKR